MTGFMQRHPSIAFFTIAFVFPWCLWSILIATTPPGQLIRQGPTPFFLILAILGGLGPSLAGLSVTAVARGKAGVRELAAGLKKTRLGVREYILVLLLIPFLTLLGVWLFSRLNPFVTLGQVESRLAMGMLWPIFSSFGEELGWRGFALPGLQKRFSPAVSALIIGLLWGVWHFPADYLGIGDQGALFYLNFFLLGPCLLTGLSVLMAWVYARTAKSLWAMVLFHYSITFSGIVLSPQGLEGWASVQYNLLTVSLVWLAAFPALRSLHIRPRTEQVNR